MKSVKMLSVVVIAVLLLTACGIGGNSQPAVQVTKDYSGEVDMEALTARRYRALQEAQAAKDYSGEIDMEVLTARRYRAPMPRSKARWPSRWRLARPPAG